MVVYVVSLIIQFFVFEVYFAANYAVSVDSLAIICWRYVKSCVVGGGGGCCR